MTNTEFLDKHLQRLTIPVVLALVLVFGFFGLVVLAFFHAPPNGSTQIVTALLMAVSSSVTGIVGYYFGSSAGSAKKTDLLSKQTEPPAEIK